MDGPLAIPLRPFGHQAGDLDLDLRRAPRPQLVSALLAGCGNLPLEQVWELSIGRRTLLLTAIATAQGADPLEAGLTCSRSGCGERMSVDFSLDELAEIQQQAEALPALTVESAGGRQTLRRPNGRDQLRWQSAAVHSEAEALALVLSTLLVPGSAAAEAATTNKDVSANDLVVTPFAVAPDSMAALDAAMQDFDPLVHFTVRVTCPACGAEQLQAVDLQELALARLHALQQDLIWQAHHLALHYHWGEAEILALPGWRRQRYLRLLDKEGLL